MRTCLPPPPLGPPPREHSPGHVILMNKPPDPRISPPVSLHGSAVHLRPWTPTTDSRITPRPLAYPVSCSAFPCVTPLPGRRTLLWVADTLSRMRYTWWIRGRRSVFVRCHQMTTSPTHTAYDLLAANNTPIPTYGTRTLRLSFTPASPFV
ncbi:hypothetical protein GWK47_051933 [Chionoecetes opilio]|uniref:Uncharacterized protein n=1 Tax=Chionoecetes opilio TaxID=41210 RepID=A0A8J4YCB1_CHIOP|nr:hypothetical protein GWK47_051933 [Chionoecetes opilio]